MGAANSKPHTVEMPNTIPFQVSADVFERVRLATIEQSKDDVVLCDNCYADISQATHLDGRAANIPHAAAVGNDSAVKATRPTKQQEQHNTIEVEKSQFEKTLEHVNKLFGQPVKWSQDYSDDIFELEKKLLECYRQCGDEPLKCADIAKQYHTFVSSNQINAIHENIKDGKPDFDYANKKH